MRSIATSPGPTVATDILTLVAHRYCPIVAMSYLTLAVQCCWTASSDGLSNINGPSLLDCVVAMA
jgi:hypothetical protein